MRTSKLCLVCCAALFLVSGLAEAEESAWTLLKKGLKLYRHKRYNDAEHCFRAAADMDSRCGDAHYYLGVLAERKGASKEAKKHYARIQKESSVHSLAAERVGMMALKAGDLKTAEEKLAIVCKDRPSAGAWMQLAAIQLDAEKYKEAEKSLAAGEKLSKDNLDLVELKGRLFMETDRPKDAVVAYSRILKVISVDNNARYLRGTAYLELDRSVDARADFDEVLKRDPWHAGTLRALIRMYKDDPTMSARVKEYRKRLAILKKHPPKVRQASGSRREAPPPVKRR